MSKSICLLLFIFSTCYGFSQAKVDLDRSVPLWLEHDTETNQSILKWIVDDNAPNYIVSESDTEPSLTALATLDGSDTEYNIGELIKGKEYGFHLAKGTTARGIIRLGLELPATHHRGRCLIAIDDILPIPLKGEIDQLIDDISMDGWLVDTIHVSQSDIVFEVKDRIVAWYDNTYQNAQSLFLLGHVPVPYSGNSAHDGHTNHQGAWAADVYYGDIDGIWRDITVNNTTPSRDKNKNVPFDGKFDNTLIPSNVELEVGRVDFNDLPAFPDDEIELTRQYLNKSHDFKVGNKDYPRRALVENNFGGFAEGFGQSGWRNFTTMFGGDNVSVQNYDVVLETDKYLYSYACGGGSYTSCSGVGTTANLWVAKDVQSIFTMTFGSYFGDWDSQNNFLRSALGSGDVLTNAWAGRPVWQMYHMAIGKNIGHSARITQNASGSYYSQSNSPKSAHIALMGDPTLRLHAVKKVHGVSVTLIDGDIQVDWLESPDASHGYFVYRRENGANWALIGEFIDTLSFLDYCVNSNTEYEYMVKAIKLESTGSGSYFNTSLGLSVSITIDENPFLSTYYADSDMDGFGDPNNQTTSCSIPTGFIDNDLDCDDTNGDINPNGEEVPNNGIDEDCDGADLLVGVDELEGLELVFYPNPTDGIIMVRGEDLDGLKYRLYNVDAEVVMSGDLKKRIDVSNQVDGLYWLEVMSIKNGVRFSKMVFLMR